MVSVFFVEVQKKDHCPYISYNNIKLTTITEVCYKVSNVATKHLDEIGKQ